MRAQNLADVPARPARGPRALTPLGVLVIHEEIRSERPHPSPRRRRDDHATPGHKLRVAARRWRGGRTHQAAVLRESEPVVDLAAAIPKPVWLVREADGRTNCRQARMRGGLVETPAKASG